MGDTEPQVSAPGPAREPTPEEIAANEERYKRRVAGYIQLLKDKNLNFRWRAAEALGELGDPSAVEPLIEALRDPFVDVQWLAAKSLGKIGDSRAVGPLLEALKSEDKWLRVGAAWGLGKSCS
jgi:HEAT repeat protein